MANQDYQPIGLLGGSFNPVHIGHLNIAQQIQEALDLDEVWLIPAWVSPYKTSDTGMAPARDRLIMCNLAIQNMAGLKVCDIEIQRGDVSFTSSTLRELREINKWEKPPVLILGSDAADGLPGWRDITDIIDSIAYVCIVERRTNPLEASFWESLDDELGDGRGMLLQSQMVTVDPVDISSTRIRESIRKQIPVDKMLQRGVQAYIQNHGLYS